MIENVPTANELRTVSLRLYFKAWSEVTAIVTEWGRFSGLATPDWSPERGHFYLDAADSSGDEAISEWRDYIEAAQSDLQGIYTLIQQSQEIGLKARICDVSPYLLLKRTDIKPADSATNTWDFTDFPTIDASELVRVHNTFCSTVLSKEFQAMFDEIRRNRNKMYHLGIYRRALDPQVIIDILQMHYTELYPGRRWMEDRLHFATLHRWANYADSDYNERSDLFHELWQLLPGLSEGQYRWLMGHEREEHRLICFSCSSDARLGGHQPYETEVPTAFKVGDTLEIRCVICDGVYPMKAGTCPNDECESELISASEESEGKCMQCGWSHEEWGDQMVEQKAYRSTSLDLLGVAGNKGDEA